MLGIVTLGEEADLAQTAIAVLALVTYLELRIARIVRQAANEWLHTQRIASRVEVLEQQQPANGAGEPRNPPA